MIPRFPLEDEFGDIIKKARLGKGWTVGDLASQVGLKPEVLQAMESYAIKPSCEQAAALADPLSLHAQRLWQIAQDQYAAPNQAAQVFSETDGPYFVNSLPGEPGEANCYLAANRSQGTLYIIDPGVSAERITAAIAAIGLAPTGILVTHEHHDHTQSLDSLVQMFELDPDSLLAPGAEKLPAAFSVAATPGHTEDSKCFIFSAAQESSFAFVGDLLFAGSVGRALPGTDWYQTHLKSAATILELAPDTVLFPGHGPITTVESERAHNPFVFKE